MPVSSAQNYRPTSILLAVGDGTQGTPPQDALNLVDGTNYTIIAGSLTMPTLPDPLMRMSIPRKFRALAAAGEKAIEMELLVKGATADQLWANMRALEYKLRQARLAAGPDRAGPSVFLWVRLGASSSYVYFDIVGGSLTPHDTTGMDGRHYEATLELACREFSYGDPITYTLPTILQNGAPTPVFLSGVPGDAPALAQIILTDQSGTAACINRIRVGTRTRPHQRGSDYQLTYPVQVQPAALLVADSTAISNQLARLQTVAGQSWQTIGRFAPPTVGLSAEQQSAQHGLYDLYLRVRNGLPSLAAPTGIAGTAPVGVAGAVLPFANYQYMVTSFSAAGVESVPSVVQEIDLTPPWQYHDTFDASTISSWYTQTLSGASTTMSTRTVGAIAGSGDLRVVWNTPGDAYLTSVISTPMASMAFQIKIKINSVGGIAAQVLGLTLSGATAGVTVLLIYSTSWYISIGTVGGSSTLYAMPTLVAGTVYTFEVRYDSSIPAAPQVSVLRTVAGVQTTLLTVGVAPSALISLSLQVGVTAYPTFTGNVDIDYDDLYLQYATVSTPPVTLGLINENTNALAVTWTPDSAASKHRVYWQRQLSPTPYPAGYPQGPVYYADTGDPSTMTILNEAVAGVLAGATDLSGVDMTPVDVRLQLAAPGGTDQLMSLPSVAPQIAHNGQWMLLYMGTSLLPVSPVAEGTATSPWQVYVQVKPGTTTSLPQVDVDSLWLLAHDEPQQVAEATGLALTAPNRTWVLDTRRDGVTVGAIFDVPGGTLVASVPVRGQLLVGPGDVALPIIVDSQGGVSDVVNAKYSVTVRLVPRYFYVTGQR